MAQVWIFLYHENYLFAFTVGSGGREKKVKNKIIKEIMKVGVRRLLEVLLLSLAFIFLRSVRWGH